MGGQANSESVTAASDIQRPGVDFEGMAWKCQPLKGMMSLPRQASLLRFAMLIVPINTRIAVTCFVLVLGKCPREFLRNIQPH